MKNFILTFCCLVLYISLTHAQEKKDLYTVNEQEVIIEFTTKYQLEDLVNVKTDLALKEIKIVYSSLQFDDNGYLKQISASIAYPDGQKGSFVSTELQPEVGPGFRRDF